MTEEIPIWSEFAQVLSLPLSLFIAWMTVRLTMSDQRALMIQQEVARMINDILDKSRETKDLTLLHLQGGNGSGFVVRDARASKIQILNRIKSIEVARLSLDAFLGKTHSTKLKDGLTEWKKCLTGDRFPVEQKEDICKPGDQPLIAIENAHQDWECLCQKIKASILKSSWMK
ncbi:MAG: hypothetical protein PHF70_07835 [Opitutales bacterium]|nr:hypothetical protein [Opitutales bacterium]